MLSELEPLQMDEKGKLGPMRDVCVVAAQRTFLARMKTDTNPLLVQMIHLGVLIPHWYYRSEEWIDQPYFFPAQYLQPYRGPAQFANPGFYGPDTFVIDQDLMNFTMKNF